MLFYVCRSIRSCLLLIKCYSIVIPCAGIRNEKDVSLLIVETTKSPCVMTSCRQPKFFLSTLIVAVRLLRCYDADVVSAAQPGST